MKTTLITLFGFFIYINSHAAVEEAFVESLKLSENMEIAKLINEKSSEEVNLQASKLYPNFNLIGNSRFGNNTLTQESGLDRFDSNFALNLDYDIFKGGSEYSIYKLKLLLPKKNALDYEKNVTDYFTNFITLYYNVSSSLEENENQNRQIGNLVKRISLLEARVKIGQDKRSDLFALKAQLARFKADLSKIKSKVRQALTNFSNFSAIKNQDDQFYVDKSEAAKLTLPTDFNKNEQLDYKLSSLEVENLDYQARIKRAAYFPTINLSSNYYLDSYRSAKDDWDVALRLTFNLYDFGKTRADVAQANIAKLIAQKNFELKDRTNQAYWDSLTYQFEQKKEEYKNLAEALNFSKSAYELQLQDLNRGLINQIDLIRSLDDVLALEKIVINSGNELKILYYQAKSFLGEIPGNSL